MDKQFGSIAPGPEPDEFERLSPSNRRTPHRSVATRHDAYLKLATMRRLSAIRISFPGWCWMPFSAVRRVSISGRVFRTPLRSGAPGVSRWSSASRFKCRRGLLPTEHPFLYLISATAIRRCEPRRCRSRGYRDNLGTLRRNGIADREVVKAGISFVRDWCSRTTVSRILAISSGFSRLSRAGRFIRAHQPGSQRSRR